MGVYLYICQRIQDEQKKIAEKLSLGTNTLPRNMTFISIHY